MRVTFGLLNKNLQPAYAFFALTAFAYIFSRVYTFFSHGETSEHISSMWFFLLCFGTAFYFLEAIIFTLIKSQPNRIGLEVYSSGILAYTAGMFMNGLFEIFGHDRSLVQYYHFAGIGLMVAGFIIVVFFSQKLSAKQHVGTNVFALFIKEKTVERTGARITARELHSLHKNWAYSNGYRPMKRKKFISELNKQYKVIRLGIAGSMVLGLALRGF